MKLAARVLAGGAVGLALVAGAAPASAQKLVVAANADVASGLEGGSYDGGLGVRRARTTIRVGVDAFVNENPESAIAGALLLELEPHTAVGFDLRYQRIAFERIAFDIGLTALLVPGTMFGAEAGITYRQPILPHVWLTIGPTLTGYFVGSDLPERAVVWQGLLRGGFRVGF